MHWLRNKWIRRTLIVVVAALLLFLFRIPILRGAGNFLITESESVHGDVIVVLGGNSLDRGNYAAELYHEGLAPEVLCTGGNIPSVLEALDTSLYESEITQSILEKRGVPSDNIIPLKTSTSTREEAAEVDNYLQNTDWDTLIIVSSKFHLRRVRNVFQEQFEDQPIVLNFRGAPSSQYDEETWWKSEAGLIMVNNEWVKTVYYWFGG